MNNKFFLFCTISVVSTACWAGYKYHTSLLKTITHLSDVVVELEAIKNESQAVSSKAVVAAPTVNWLDVQKKAQDTVVQIFVQLTRYNFIEPYKTPQQGEACGSGFFINDQGYILTNYHVVDDATTLQVQISSFGKEQFDVEVVGVCPDRDLALLRLSEKAYKEIVAKRGSIPYLTLGDSDRIRKTHEILALGYPLLQQMVKSTQGIVSGQEWLGGNSYFQITAPLNPGNSGGPALNSAGEVIGINTAGIPSAQNIGFVIPINEVKSTLKDLWKIPFLRKPILGCIFTISTKEHAQYLQNPDEGGWYIARVFSGSTLDKAGVKEGDMLYSINGHRVDRFGEITVGWAEDKVPALALFNRLVVGDSAHLVLYRNGERKEIDITLETRVLQPIRQVYPLYEPFRYEIVGGMVVMELTVNHILAMLDRAPFLMNYTKPENQTESRLIITHVLPNSSAYKSRLISPGDIIREINGIEVKTLDDFKKAVMKPVDNKFLTVRFIDRIHDDMFVVLPITDVIKEESVLAQRFFYEKSTLLTHLESSLQGVLNGKTAESAA